MQSQILCLCCVPKDYTSGDLYLNECLDEDKKEAR